MNEAYCKSKAICVACSKTWWTTFYAGRQTNQTSNADATKKLWQKYELRIAQRTINNKFWLDLKKSKRSAEWDHTETGTP